MKDILSKVDHTLLAPEATWGEIKALCDGLATAVTPKWLENDAANHLTKVVSLPAREDIDFEFEEQLIVELYSK